MIYMQIILNILTLANGLYTCIRYLCYRNVSRLLVIFFYVFVVINTILVATLQSFRLFDTYDFSETDIFIYSEAALTLVYACTFWLDGLTMIWFSISLRLMLNQTTKESALQSKKILFALTLVFILLFSPLVFLIKEPQMMHEVRLASDSTICLMNAGILIYLNHQLKQFGAHNLQACIKSINKQFSIYLFAYVMLCGTDIFYAFFRDSNFWYHIPATAIENTIILIPINYVIYIHRFTFKKDNETRSTVTATQSSISPS